VDVRFICATNRDPLQEVAAGRFREDLYYRLHVIPIHMPALRERKDDVLLLARYFLAKIAKEEGKAFCGLAPEAQDALLSFDWPGNVRQLQNVIRNAVVLHNGDQITVEMLRLPLKVGPPSPTMYPVPVPGRCGYPESIPPAANAGLKPLWLVEKEAIERAIDYCGGNIPRAAALLEVSPSTIYRKLKTWTSEGA